MSLLEIKIQYLKWIIQIIHVMDLRTDSLMKKTSVDLKMEHSKLSKLSAEGTRTWKELLETYPPVGNIK